MELQNIPVDKLAPNPFRPRQTFDKERLFDLSSSIRKYGVLTPLLVAQTPAGLQIVVGERRWRAAKLAGLNEIPCIVLKDLTPAELGILSFTENLQTEPLNLLDQAGVLSKLKEEYQFSDFDIAEKLGLNEEKVREILKVLDLPDQVKTSYLKGEICRTDLLALADIEDPVELLEEFHHYAKTAVVPASISTLINNNQ